MLHLKEVPVMGAGGMEGTKKNEKWDQNIKIYQTVGPSLLFPKLKSAPIIMVTILMIDKLKWPTFSN